MDEEARRRLGEGAPLTATPLPTRGRSAPLRAAALTGLALLCGTATARDDRDSFAGATSDSMVTDEQRSAVKSALAWIASKEQNGGKWGTNTGEGTDTADTALSLLALMAGGNTLAAGTPERVGSDRTGVVAGPTRRGQYADKVQEGVDFLARLAWTKHGSDPLGYINDGDVSNMHGHGFATLALATACGGLGPSRIDLIEKRVAQGLSPADLPLADRVRLGLTYAVRVIRDAQDIETGGWMYGPYPSGHEGSMTVTQITALRAAREVGIAVDNNVIKKAQKYVRDSQNVKHRDLVGGFAYQLHEKDRVSVGLTAAALTTFFGTGRYGDETDDRRLISDAMAFIVRKFDDEAFDTRKQFYYYRLFYLVQALYLSGDELLWQKYWPKIREEILSRQDKDGSFTTRVDDGRSAEYCTAMGCLILQTPMETLPIFQRR